MSYDVKLEDDSLSWSGITALKRIGLVYEPGLRFPLLATELSELRREARLTKSGHGLHQGDPFGTRPPKRSRGVGRGGRVGGRSVGRGRVGGRGHGLKAGAFADPDAQQAHAGDLDGVDGTGGEHGDLGEADAPTANGEASEQTDPAFVGVEGLWADGWDAFDLEGELATIMDDDAAELGATFVDQAQEEEDIEEPADANASGSGEALVAFQHVLADAADEEAAAPGLGDVSSSAAAAAGPGLPSDSAAGGFDRVMAPVVPTLVNPHAGVSGPSPLGYCTLEGETCSSDSKREPCRLPFSEVLPSPLLLFPPPTPLCAIRRRVVRLGQGVAEG